MGVPKTTDTEREWIKELLAGREKGKDLETEESESDEASKKKEATPQRTSRDLVAKKRTSEGGGGNCGKRGNHERG